MRLPRPPQLCGFSGSQDLKLGPALCRSSVTATLSLCYSHSVPTCAFTPLSCMYRPCRSCQRAGSSSGGGAGRASAPSEDHARSGKGREDGLAASPATIPHPPRSQPVVLFSIHSSGSVTQSSLGVNPNESSQGSANERTFCKESANNSFRLRAPERLL